MLGELIPSGGGDPIPLLKPKLVVGRKPPCDITLPFGNVSGRHCELELHQSCWLVRDLGSTNGTRVNGELVKEKYLPPGAQLAVSTHRFNIVYELDPDEAPPETTVETLKRESLLSKAGITVEGPAESVGLRPQSGSLGELVPTGGGEPIPLFKPRLQIGRLASCDIPLRFPTVSGRHCELEFRDSYWFVRDLGSRNGITVDGQRCDSSCLRPGSVLAITQHRYKIVYAPPDNKRPPPDNKVDFTRSLLDKAGLDRRKK